MLTTDPVPGIQISKWILIRNTLPVPATWVLVKRRNTCCNLSLPQNLINMAEIATVILLFRATHHPLKMVLPVCLSPKMGETFKGRDLHTHSPKWFLKPLGCVWISVGPNTLQIYFEDIFRLRKLREIWRKEATPT
jgi:hypothetical protein